MNEVDQPVPSEGIKREYSWTEAAQLGELMGMAHDHDIDLDEVIFDKAAKQVVLPVTGLDAERHRVRSFLCFETYEQVIRPARLTIENVEDYELTDEAEIGVAIFNEIKVRGDRVTITSGIPVTFRFRVTSLHVRLTLLDQIEDTRRFTILSFRREGA